MGMRALVTGATGFIGRALVRRLVKEGVDVVATSRWGGTVEGGEAVALDLSRLDGDDEPLASLVIDAVFHLAADIPTSFGSPEGERSWWTNTVMTSRVLRIASLWRCPVVYASGTSVYGSRPPAPCTEAAPVCCEDPYAEGKYAGERLCQEFSERTGRAVAVLRISAPYGPGFRRQTVVTRFLSQALRSEDLTLYGTGQRRQDFTFVEDAVAALWLAGRRSATGVFNVASGWSVSMRELAECVLAAVPGTRSKILEAGVPDPQEHYRPQFSIQHAMDELGYRPAVTLPEGLSRLAATLAREGR